MEKIKIMALGGLDEDGKNMTLVEVDDDLYIIEAGLKFPDTNRLGVEIIIPSFDYLIENKKRVKAIFITHGHDDVMGALPYLLNEIQAPVYTTPFNVLILEKLLKDNKVEKYTLKTLDRYGKVRVGRRLIKIFGLTHSMFDTYGLAIPTSAGYIVFASEYIIDFDTNIPAFQCDVTEFANLGKQGVFALMTESRNAERPGFTAPSHRIGRRIEDLIPKGDKGRVLITLYQQNVFRLIEVLNLARKMNKKIYFANKNQDQYIKYFKQLNYYQAGPDLVLSDKDFNNDQENVIIVVSDQGPNVFRRLFTIASGDHSCIQLRPSDTVIIGSPVVAGIEEEAAKTEDELFRDGVRVVNLSRSEYFTMHPSSEDLKMMLSLLKPKYYIPIKGEYRHLIENANLALNKGLYADHIVVLDNGQQALFENGELVSTKVLFTPEPVYIDGKDSLDSSGLVLRDREILSTDGVIIVGIVLDFKSKKVIGGPDVQSRGVVYIKDADYVIKQCGIIMENVVNEAVKSNSYDNIQCRNKARDQISRYVFKQTDKKPIVLTVIIEIRNNE